MTRPAHTFKTAKAKANLETMTDVLITRGGASTRDLALATGLSLNTVGTYLRHMELIGTACCQTSAVWNYGAGSSCAWWVPGNGTVDQDDSIDDLPRQVVVRTQREPIRVRMPMECLLFGQPGSTA